MSIRPAAAPARPAAAKPVRTQRSAVPSHGIRSNKSLRNSPPNQSPPHGTRAPETQEDIVVDQTCSPAERAAAISAFKNGASVNAVASMLGKTPGSVEWLLKKNGLKKT